MSTLFPTYSVQEIIGNGPDKMSHDDKVSVFESILSSTGRKGIDEVIAFLHTTDFYDAPASQNHHSNYKHGLLDHSLLVYLVASKFGDTVASLYGSGFTNTYSDENIALASLLHDVCKCAVYVPALRWKKDTTGSWFNYYGYEFNDTFPIGHGEKSVIMLQKIGLELNVNEIIAIRYHMGFWGDAGQDVMRAQMSAVKMCPLSVVLQMADYTASTVFEKEYKPEELVVKDN